MNVLVFPCGSEIALEVYRSLCFSTHVNLYGASSVLDHGESVYKQYIGGLPQVTEEGFIEAINAVIAAHDIDFIYPAHDSVVLAFAEAASSNLINCKVIASPVETCRIARSKRNTYMELASLIPTPQIYSAERQPVKYPVFAKPDVGQGSKGTKIIESPIELEAVLNLDESMIVCEYLPGEEFTVDCFTDRLGELRFVQGRDRSRTSNGISVRSETAYDPAFNEIAELINTKLAFRGGWFFQLKRGEDGTLKLLEIATRIAGTSGVTRALGVNLPLLSLFDAKGSDVLICKNEYSVTVDRALYNVFKLNISYEHVYVDFDDLILRNDNVNPQVIAFLYDCRNKGKRIHMITRHTSDVHTTLKQIALSYELFEDIQLVRKTENKADYMKEPNAIFIDDSFAERQDVYNSLGIPTFDAHMIEALLT